MQFGTTTDFPTTTSNDRAFFLEDEPKLIEQLRAFGLIEANAAGGWQLIEGRDTGPSTFADSAEGPKPARSVVHPWQPRTR